MNGANAASALSRSTRRGLPALRRPAQRAQLADIGRQVFAGDRAGQVYRNHLHILPAGGLQQPLHALAIGEGELSRCAGRGAADPVHRRWRARRGHEWVLVGTAPGDEAQPGAGCRGTMQVGEGGLGILEEHHAQPRLDPVEVRGGQRMLLRVCHDEVRVQSRRLGALAGQRQHRRGDVQAGAVGRRACG
jgi:hypothetical protein